MGGRQAEEPGPGQVDRGKEPKQGGASRLKSRPATWLGGLQKGLSQASHNKLHVNNSAAVQGLIALEPHLPVEGKGGH